MENKNKKISWEEPEFLKKNENEWPDQPDEFTKLNDTERRKDYQCELMKPVKKNNQNLKAKTFLIDGNEEDNVDNDTIKEKSRW